MAPASKTGFQKLGFQNLDFQTLGGSNSAAYAEVEREVEGLRVGLLLRRIGRLAAIDCEFRAIVSARSRGAIRIVELWADCK